MTFTTAMLILFNSLCIAQMCNWSVIHGIKRKPHLSVVWNWYHFVAIAILHQPRPTDSADINTRLQLSDTSSIPPMHGGFLLGPLARYIKLRVAHAPGMPGTFSLTLKVSDPGMHHGKRVTHVPRCMPGSIYTGFLWSLWRRKRFWYSQRMRNLQFYVSG